MGWFFDMMFTENSFAEGAYTEKETELSGFTLGAENASLGKPCPKREVDGRRNAAMSAAAMRAMLFIGSVVFYD